LKSPDVIATVSSNTALFEAQTDAAARWLASRCGAKLENPHDQFRVDAEEKDRIFKDLRAAGFHVVKQKT
jgi:hypothetical protein